jgi:NADH:ubiquinone oxidoreductase subunit 2 (subunit N)
MVLSSFNIFLLFLCFEGLTLSSIVIVALLGQNFLSLEALLNYFFMSAVSSVFFILGTSIIFLDYNLSFCFSSFRLGIDDKIFYLNKINTLDLNTIDY